MLSERDILAAMPGARRTRPAAPAADPVMPRDDIDAPNEQLLSTAQRAQIDRVLRQVNGNKTEAARLLGISRRSLYRWLDRLELKSGHRATRIEVERPT
jgi:transcriptional regulator with PAS, ATPase and Fis domain